MLERIPAEHPEKLSIIIPARNEERNLVQLLDLLLRKMDSAGFPFEIVVVDDNSSDRTQSVLSECARTRREVKYTQSSAPGGIGRAMRDGVRFSTGGVLTFVMADLSDDPDDIVAYYEKIREGYDCVFGSRFIRGSQVRNYPPVKLLLNRIFNTCLQVLFWTRHNDLTNAFKAYRRSALNSIGLLRSNDFDITVELPLSCLIRKFNIAQIPIAWRGRTRGSSHLKLLRMAPKYLRAAARIWLNQFQIHR